MTEKQAFKELKMMAFQYGLTLDDDLHGLRDADGANSYFHYTVVRDCVADYENRRADVSIRIRITVRKMGGDGMTTDELWNLKCMTENARGLLMDLEAHPLKFTEKW